VERILHLAAADLIDERPDGNTEDVHFPQALAHAVCDCSNYLVLAQVS